MVNNSSGWRKKREIHSVGDAEIFRPWIVTERNSCPSPGGWSEIQVVHDGENQVGVRKHIISCPGR